MSALPTSQSFAVAADYRIEVRAATIAGPLACLAGLLVLAHLITQVIKFTTEYDFLYGLIPLFDLDREKNLPAFFSTANLLVASLLLAIIANFKKRSRAVYANHWLVLAFLFLYLAIDEAAGLHEIMSRPTREWLGQRVQGIASVAWVIPGCGLVLLVSLSYFRFWLHLPGTIRLLVLAAAVLFVGGAAGVEVIGGCYMEQHGRETLTYGLIVMAEEGLEMAGVLVFIYALLRYVEDSFRQVQLQFGGLP